MIIHTTKIARQWHRVLKLERVYSEDRKRYEELVSRVGDVEFLSSRALRELVGGYRSSHKHTEYNFEETDYSEQVFLTRNEYDGYMVAHLGELASAEPDCTLTAWKDFYDHYVGIQKAVSFSTAINPFVSSKPDRKIFMQYQLGKAEIVNVFASESARESYIAQAKKELEQEFFEKIMEDEQNG